MSKCLIALTGLTALLGACLPSEEAPVLTSTHAKVELTNGIRLNGIRLNGVRLNGVRLNGIRLNGIRLNGIRLNGIRLNGVRLNGLKMAELPLAAPTNVHGLTSGETSLGNIVFQTPSTDQASWDISALPLQGVSVPDLGLVPHNLALAHDSSGRPLSHAEQEAALFLIDRVVACAAAPGVTISMETAAGLFTLPTTDPGENRGIDPAFITDGPDLSRSPDVANCALETAGVDYLPLLEQAFDTYMRYWASCLLADGDQIAVEQSDGSMKHYHGGLGLAPWAADAPLEPAPPAVAAVHGSDVGLRRLTACLAARVNVLGESVLLSFRGTTINAGGGIALAPGEADGYPVREGAFWGNMFSDSPAMFTCVGDGRSQNAGRLCARDAEQCGFTSVGDCPDNEVDSSYCSGIRGDEANAIRSCQVTNRAGTFTDLEEEVITTYVIRDMCGNGQLDSPEECDDGNAVNGDGCSVGCKIEHCGDGIVNNRDTEQCDDGNMDDDDGCSTQCNLNNICGDGVYDAASEECDDGNTVDGDGCSRNCTAEGSVNPDLFGACGNGVVDAGEECDDGNTQSGDGCSADCIDETY